MTMSFLAVGCQPKATAFEPHVWPQVVYTGHSQELGTPLFHVTPDKATAKPASALMLPFTISQEIEDPVRIGTEVGRIFWNTWRSADVFSSLSFSELPQWPDRATALEQARMTSAELVVLGRVTHLLLGGSQADSSLALQVDIYDTDSGELVWSMQHSGLIEAVRDEDFIFFVIKDRMPEGSGLVLVRDLALDLAAPVRLWQWPLPDPEEQTPENGTAVTG